MEEGFITDRGELFIEQPECQRKKEKGLWGLTEQEIYKAEENCSEVETNHVE